MKSRFMHIFHKELRGLKESYLMSLACCFSVFQA